MEAGRWPSPSHDADGSCCSHARTAGGRRRSGTSPPFCHRSPCNDGGAGKRGQNGRQKRASSAVTVWTFQAPRRATSARSLRSVAVRQLELPYGNRTIIYYRRSHCRAERDHQILIYEMLTRVKRKNRNGVIFFVASFWA